MDWKASLENLRAELPEGGEIPLPEAGSDPGVRPGKLRVLLDRKGRKGKEATIVEGFTLPDDEVSQIASQIKQKLGVGGSARGGEILIQGDKRQPVAEQLRAMGYNCKII